MFLGLDVSNFVAQTSSVLTIFFFCVCHAASVHSDFGHSLAGIHLTLSFFFINQEYSHYRKRTNFSFQHLISTIHKHVNDHK